MSTKNNATPTRAEIELFRASFQTMTLDRQRQW